MLQDDAAKAKARLAEVLELIAKRGSLDSIVSQLSDELKVAPGNIAINASIEDIKLKVPNEKLQTKSARYSKSIEEDEEEEEYSNDFEGSTAPPPPPSAKPSEEHKVSADTEEKPKTLDLSEPLRVSQVRYSLSSPRRYRLK